MELFPAVIQREFAGWRQLRYSEECVQFITDWSTENLQRLQMYLGLSGHGVNQLGSYDACLATADSNYYLCFAGNPTPGFIGICFSKVCSAEDIMDLSHIFEGYGFAKVMQPQQESLSVGGYMTLAVLMLFVLTVLASTILLAVHQTSRKFGFIAKHNYFALQRSIKVFTRSGEIKFLNGVKTICFFTVVFGHEMFLRIWNAQNILNLQLQLDKPYLTLALSYIFAVDVFFYLGGFMVGFLFLKMYLRKRGWRTFVVAVLQRWLRLAPLFLMCMLIFWKVLPAWGDGPLSYQYTQSTADCPKAWWRDLLFVGNFADSMCMVWGWYIQIDMQLFLVGLVLLWLYAEIDRRAFVVGSAAVMLGGIIYCFVRCQTQGYHVVGNLDGANNPNQDKYYLDLYNKPWSRTGPYMLGLFMGIYYYNFKERQQNKGHLDLLERVMKWRLARWFCFVVGLSIVVLITWAPHTLLSQHQWSQSQNSMYLSMGRLGYSFGVCLLTLPMMLGYSNPLKTLLEWSLLQYISKLAFSCYLIHYAILSVLVYNVRTSQYVNPELTLIRGVSDLGPILLAGLVLSLTIEFPLGAIFDLLLGRKQPSRHKLEQATRSP